MGRVAPMLIVGVIFAIGGIVLVSVGIRTRGWITGDGLDVEIGLWTVCINDDCVDYDDLRSVPDSLNAVRGNTIAGACLAGLGVILTIFFLIQASKGQHDKKTLANLAFVCCILGFKCVAAGCIVYGVDIYDSEVFKDNPLIDYNLSYSFYLSCIGAAAMVIGGILITTGGTRQMALNAENRNQQQVATVQYGNAVHRTTVYNGQQQYGMPMQQYP